MTIWKVLTGFSLTLTIFFLKAGPMTAQAELPEDLRALVAVKKRVRDYLDKLPNYACLMSIDRVRITSVDRKRLEKKLRQDRSPTGASGVTLPVESRDTVQVEVAVANGREQYSWPGEQSVLERPLAQIVGGGTTSTGEFFEHLRNVFLSRAATTRFAGEEQINGVDTYRFEYELSSMFNAYSLTIAGRTATVSERGSVWVDRQTYDPIRLEVEADDIPPELAVESVTTRIEYGRFLVRGSYLLLPERSELTILHTNGDEDLNQTNFTHCREYGAASTVSFAEAGPKAAPHAPEAQEVSLPGGTTLGIRLKSPIDSSKSRVGDPIEATLEGPLKIEGQAAFPKGSKLSGRIRRLDHQRTPDDYVVLGLEFTDLVNENRHARFLANLKQTGDAEALLQKTPHSSGSREVNPAFSGSLIGATWEKVTQEAYSNVELPGVGILYFRGSRFTLTPGLSMTWTTLAPKTAPGK